MAYIDAGNVVGMTGTGTTNVFTADAETVVTGVVVRLASVSGFVTVPTVSFERNDGAKFCNAQPLTGLSTTGKAVFVAFTGALPVLAAGEILRANVSVAAGASAYSTEVDVLGYVVP